MRRANRQFRMRQAHRTVTLVDDRRARVSVAEELGTWSAEQALVLVDVLQRAGLHPAAKRVRDGVIVTVPDDEADEANRQLLNNMDAIARAAAKPTGVTGPKRRIRAVKGADNPNTDPRALASERMARIARPIGLILIATLLLGMLRNPFVVLVVMGGLIYLIGKRAQRDGGGFDDPRRF